MASLVLFHSVLGLRQVELEAAARLRGAGHEVILPDLFDGAKTDDLDEGFAIKARIGWDVIRERALAASAGLPSDAVLAGISMGAGVLAEVWPFRPNVRCVLLVRGLAALPRGVRPGTPVHLHIAEDDPFFPGTEVSDWEIQARRASLSVNVFTYRDAGHYFIDSASPGYNEEAATMLWQRLLGFLTVVSADRGRRDGRSAW